MSMLELREVTKKYGDKLALNSVSLTFEGGIYGLLGPNGAGKSTLMNLITGTLRPSGGTVKWNGRDIAALGASYRRLLGVVPQRQGMYDAFTGRRFLAYMAALKGIGREELPGETERVLTCVHMTRDAGRKIGSCSGGMKQRLLIAQALLGDPALIVLDEPTAGLDPKERVRVREIVSALPEDKIVLFSTHVVSDIEPIAKEIVLLKDGSVLDRAPVSALCRKYRAKGCEEVYIRLFGGEDGE